MAGPAADDIIEIPSDLIAMGHDADGLPKTVVVEPEEEPKVREPDPEVKTLKQRLEEAERERERLRTEHQTERAAREKAEKDRDVNSHYAIRAHRDAVTARYQEATQAQSEIETGLSAAQTIRASLEEAKRRVITDDNIDPHERARQQVKIDSDLQALAARMETLEAGKRGVESRVAEARQTYEETERRLSALQEREREPKVEDKPEVKVPQPPKNADEFIAVAPTELKGWLAEHREFADPNSDENVDLQGFAAKWLRKNGGNHAALNSEAFREALDAKFFPEDTKEMTTEEPDPEPAPRRATPKPNTRPAAAPVMRDKELYSSRNPNAKAGKLPPKLAEKVRGMGLDPTKYFHECVDLIKKGELPKNFLDHDYDHSY